MRMVYIQTQYAHGHVQMVHEYTPFVNNPRSGAKRREDRVWVVNEQTFRTARFKGVWEQAGFDGFYYKQSTIFAHSESYRYRNTIPLATSFMII